MAAKRNFLTALSRRLRSFRRAGASQEVPSDLLLRYRRERALYRKMLNKARFYS